MTAIASTEVTRYDGDPPPPARLWGTDTFGSHPSSIIVHALWLANTTWVAWLGLANQPTGAIFLALIGIFAACLIALVVSRGQWWEAVTRDIAAAIAKVTRWEPK